MHQHNREKFEEICELIKGVDPNGDAIAQTMKLKRINEKFRITVMDEKLLGEIFEMFNARALDDEDFILSLVIVITSRQLDTFIVNGKILRHAMLTICQKNFQNVDNFKRDDMNKFYNSLRLLGEFFNKARLSNGVPINIIGQSLLNLINVELEKELRNICHLKTEHFAKLILSQIALNGSLLKTRHKTEVEQVLFTIRKCLIELASLMPKTKAFLLMSLDLYYSNFTNVGETLEKMYETFLVEDIKVGTAKVNHVENGKIPSKSSPENGKVQTSMEKLTLTQKYDESKRPKPPRNLRVQTRRVEPVKSRSTLTPTSPAPSSPLTPQANQRGPLSPRQYSKNLQDNLPSPTQNNKTFSKSPQKLSPRNHYDTKSSIPDRYSSQTPPPYRQPQRSQSSDHRPSKTPPPYRRGERNLSTGRHTPQTSPTSRPAPQTPPSSRYNHQNQPKKLSPLDLRSKKSPSSSSRTASLPRRGMSSKNSRDSDEDWHPPRSESVPPTHHSPEDNILRQQNSSGYSPSSSGPAKYRSNSKVYFLEENVENLEWNGNGETSFDGENDGDLDASASPKVNPYSSSFLNFLSSNLNET